MSKKIYVENEKGELEKAEVDYGTVIASKDDGMVMTVVGKSSFEDMNNLIYSALYHLYESSVKNFGENHRDAIYDRAVQMFSLTIDKFHPDKKEGKYGDLTDEDIKKMEDEKIDTLYKQKKG